ncbi:MAG TPA: hypothetical protein PLN30_00430 [Ferruginibacter sp.]|nr:hypothetical protein [Ferruginibacter sp.]
MLSQVKMFTVVCDNCAVDIATDQEYSCWSTANYAEENAIESDWLKEGDKHYCTNCFSYDGDDRLVLKTIKKMRNGGKKGL